MLNRPVVKIETGSMQLSTGNIRPRAVKGSMVISNEGAAINGCSPDSWLKDAVFSCQYSPTGSKNLSVLSMLSIRSPSSIIISGKIELSPFVSASNRRNKKSKKRFSATSSYTPRGSSEAKKSEKNCARFCIVSRRAWPYTPATIYIFRSNGFCLKNSSHRPCCGIRLAASPISKPRFCKPVQSVLTDPISATVFWKTALSCFSALILKAPSIFSTSVSLRKKVYSPANTISSHRVASLCGSCSCCGKKSACESNKGSTDLYKNGLIV